MKEYSRYDQILEQARGSAKYWIPKLCQALREENSELSDEDIRERVTQDCISVWQRATINNALPQEYKNKERSQAGKKGRQKQLEHSNGTVTITEEPTKLWAEDDSDSSSEQELHGFDRPSTEKIVSQLQSQLSSTKQELEDAKKAMAALQEKKNMEDAAGMDDGIAQLVRGNNITRVSDSDKKRCEVFIDRIGELIRRRISNNGKATIKFYILAKRRSTTIDYLIPVTFKVNFEEMTASLALDNSRI
jgi:hypothetical protein